MRYIISYDLVAPGRDYQTLWDELARMGAHRVLHSQWAVRLTETSAPRLRDHFQQFIDSNDRLLVTCLDSSDWAAFKAMTDLNNV